MNVAHYANLEEANGHGPSAGAWLLFLLAPLVGGALAAGVFRGTRRNEYDPAFEEEEVKLTPRIHTPEDSHSLQKEGEGLTAVTLATSL